MRSHFENYLVSINPDVCVACISSRVPSADILFWDKNKIVLSDCESFGIANISILII